MSESTDRPRLKKPTYSAPKAPPKWEELPYKEALEDMKNHLQTAVILELYTIPLYLFAAYAIKDNDLSTYKIISVVKQEMLHLGLAGNILCSIGGTPCVYGNEFTPKYPREIFYEPVAMNLLPATKDTIHTFMKIEEPYPSPEALFMKETPLLPEYDSIGQFYQYLLHGLNVLDRRAKEEGYILWQKPTFPKQFQTADGSWYDGDMQVITDLKVAKRALDVIILQGEGATGETITSGIQSHYQVFKELYEEHPLDCYPVEENINPDNYKEEKFYWLMIASNAVYSYLLLTIQTLWQYDGPLRGRLVTNNVMNTMLTILKPLAQFLVKQEIKTGPKIRRNAACPYRRFDFKNTDTALEELVAVMEKGLAEYPNEESLKGVMEDTKQLIDLKEVKLSS
ncbi:hypothetical protein FRB90_001837 [Tulasnella sp. 427]|nr:hypothetical protein FRB90_001837 [Tulasnella sp. 427]